MQPPPRKSNYAKFLKTLHSEQVTKLQAKNQHECDLLEDIRNFTLKRSAIEKSYSEALLKISSAFLNKKIPNIPDIKTEGSEEKWNMWNVWRTVLEENEKLARARLAAVEVFHQQIADDAKFLRSNKVQTAKKCVDQIVVIQKELQTCVQDVDKTKKFYFDEEHTAHDVRDKARDIEEKLKKKKGSFFQSITSLQKNSAKVTSKREALEEKSTGARNDYLLSLASANAHQTRYFVVDLQSTMQTMESCVFEKVAEYLTLIGRTELLTCSATQNSFGRIRDQAQQLTREYNLQCLYLFYPVLKQHIQYEFEPCDNDTISRITAEHPSVVQSLSKEAKRWATRISRENINAREYTRRLQVFQGLRDSGQKVDPNDQNGPDLEMKIEELKHNIRRSETAKMKAEARIECLRQGGVNVDEWLQDVDNLSVQDMQRSASALSVRTDASGAGEAPSSDSLYDSDFDVGSEVTPMERPDSVELVRDEETDRQDAAEVDAMVEQERQRLEQLTAGWDDPTQVDWGHAEEESFTQATATTVGSETDADSLQQQTPGAAPDTPVMDIVLSYKCIALYNYTSQNPDELSIVENEQLEVIGEGDGDGWLRARNYRGEEGYVPHNYLDVDQESGTQQSGSSFQLVSQISFSSVDYTVDETDEAITEVEVGAMPSDEPSPQHHPGDNGASYCVALYDYEATCLEELMFTEGQVIRVLRKVVHDDVDDGWWEGELDGRTGLFPSLVVEECHADGEPITPQDDDDAPSSAPPVFTPPDIPSFMLAPQQVIITQATPMGEHPDSDKTTPVEKSSSPTSTEQAGFSMELSRGHYRHYDAQFGEDDVPTITVVEAPTICIDENGEEDVPSIQINLDQEAGGSSEGGDQQEPDFGLGVAQIVITAATPMVEEPEQPFPPPPTEEEQEQGGRETQSEHQEQDDTTSEEPPPYEEAAALPEEIDDPADDLPTDSAPFPISSSTGSEEDTYTGPSTAENSQSHPLPPPLDHEGSPGLGLEPREKGVWPELREKKAGPEPQEKEGAEPQEEQIQTVMTRVEGGRGSIPDELEPHQLAQLQDLKESNA